jgi:zona occludens toxin
MEQGQGGAPGEVRQAGQAGGGGDRLVDPVVDAKNYMWSQTPRVSEVPSTAPKYDELTKPTVAPRMAACVSRPSGCKCYTQQGTPYPVNHDMCMDVVKNGYFQEFKDKEDERIDRQDRKEPQERPNTRLVAEPQPTEENTPVTLSEPPEQTQHVVRPPPPHGKG